MPSSSSSDGISAAFASLRSEGFVVIKTALHGDKTLLYPFGFSFFEKRNQQARWRVLVAHLDPQNNLMLSSVKPFEILEDDSILRDAFFITITKVSINKRNLTNRNIILTKHHLTITVYKSHTFPQDTGYRGPPPARKPHFISALQRWFRDKYPNKNIKFFSSMEDLRKSTACAERKWVISSSHLTQVFRKWMNPVLPKRRRGRPRKQYKDLSKGLMYGETKVEKTERLREEGKARDEVRDNQLAEQKKDWETRNMVEDKMAWDEGMLLGGGEESSDNETSYVSSDDE